MTRPPRILLFVIFSIAVFYLFRFDYWKQDLVIRGDGFAYYGYIQGFLIYHDPVMSFHGDLDEDGLYRSWMHEGLPGRYLPKMTMGLAYAWVPGFYIADAYAHLFGYPTDGWSRPYQLAVGFTGIFFLVLGCWALWQFLMLYFSKAVSSITVLIIYLSTNLLQYASVDCSMSHVYSFALISLFIYFSERWLVNCKSKHLYLAALVLGWIVLIRPTNAIIGLYLPWLLWCRAGSLSPILKLETLLAAGFALLPVIPQFIFWKATTGDWIHYSYDQESFFWSNPQIFQGLFSYRNGWLVYTPIMLLLPFGLHLLWRHRHDLAVIVGLILIVHVYITFSWWCWYYGGSLSIRPMIDMYALFAIPIAAFTAWVIRRPVVVWGAIGLLGLTLVANNVLMVKYANLGIISDSSMTKEAFWATFLQYDQPKHLNMIAAYRDPDLEMVKAGLPERTLYDTLILKELGSMVFNPNSKESVLNTTNRFSPMLRTAAAGLNQSAKTWIEIETSINCTDAEENELHVVVSFQDSLENYGYHAADVKYTGARNNQDHTVKFYVRPPGFVPANAETQVYAWLKGQGMARVFDVRATLIEVDYKSNQ